MSRSFSLRKSHRYDDIHNLQLDLEEMDARNNPEKILKMNLNNFGLYNIDRIKEAIRDKKLKLSFWEQYMLNRLFEMKAKEKEGDIRGAKEIKKNANSEYINSKSADKTAARVTSAVSKSRDIGLSSETTDKIIDAVIAANKMHTTSNLSLAALKKGGSKSVKRRSIKRRGTRKRRRTKQRQQGIKRRRTKSRH